MHKVALWAGFGVAVRLWQLGIEMRPLFNRTSIWVYPVYAGIGGSFGYWLMGVEQNQLDFLNKKRTALLEKRKRKAEREGVTVDDDALPIAERKSVVQSLKETVDKAIGSEESSASAGGAA